MDKGRLPALLAVFSCILPHGLQEKCVTGEDLSKNPFAPFLTINTVEFPDDDVIPVGYNVTIVCNGSLSKQDYGSRYIAQPHKVLLYRGGSKKKEWGGKRQDIITCTLVLQNTTITDSGVYTCLALNRMSCTIVGLNITLKEPSPPRFTVHPLHQTDIFVNHQANMSCQATGVPRPAITWFKDDHPVTGLDIRQMRSYSLLSFESVSPQDRGRYWCEATSAEEWNRSTVANLTVLKPTPAHTSSNNGALEEDEVVTGPTFYRHPESVAASRDSSVVFTCAARGFPLPGITWLKDNKVLYSKSDHGKSLLLIKSVKENNVGVYACLAVNSMGNTTSKEAVLSLKCNSSKVVWILVGTTVCLAVIVIILLISKTTKWKEVCNKQTDERTYNTLTSRNAQASRNDYCEAPL